jgi:hypothetical protein
VSRIGKEEMASCPFQSLGNKFLSLPLKGKTGRIDSGN